MCFNPHTHAGCDFVIIPLIRQVCVSIHTPTQGVTLLGSDIIKSFSSFNPHTHAGCDFGVIQARQEAVVSIHTPTQGVTCHSRSGRQAGERFNPHTHAGCDTLANHIRAF